MVAGSLKRQIKMVQIPDKKSLEVSEKIISTAETLRTVPRYLYIILATVVVLMVPGVVILRTIFFNFIISGYTPPRLVYIAPDPQPLSVVDKKLFSAGSGAYLAYARIANPNSDLGIRVLRYRFVIKGGASEILYNHEGTSYVLPGQERFLFMPVVKFEKVPLSLEVELMPERWSKIGDIRTLNFGYQQTQTGKDSTGHFYVSSLFSNENPYIIPEVEVGVLLYNLKQEAVGANFTVLNVIQVNEKRFFRVIWPQGVSFEGVTNVEFKASVNVMERNSLLTERAVLPDYYDYLR